MAGVPRSRHHQQAVSGKSAQCQPRRGSTSLPPKRSAGRSGTSHIPKHKADLPIKNHRLSTGGIRFLSVVCHSCGIGAAGCGQSPCAVSSWYGNGDAGGKWGTDTGGCQSSFVPTFLRLSLTQCLLTLWAVYCVRRQRNGYRLDALDTGFGLARSESSEETGVTQTGRQSPCGGKVLQVPRRFVHKV